MRILILASVCLLVAVAFVVDGRWTNSQEGKKEAQNDSIMEKASKLEAELGKLKDTSTEAAEVMLQLVDMYHEHARVFGLIRIGQRFVSNQPSHKRHPEAMLKLLDGLAAASRNKQTTATCRQFLLRYAEHPACPQVQAMLAETLDQMPNRVIAAKAYAALWRRAPTSEAGRRALQRAIVLYGGSNNQKAFIQAAELGEAAIEKLPRGEFAYGVGRQAVYYRERAGQYAKSNQVAIKLLSKSPPADRNALRLHHITMAENYARVGQRTNAVDSFRKARAIQDSDYLLRRQILELYNSGAKGAQIEALANEYFQKHPQLPDRFTMRAYVAKAYLRSGDKPRGLAMIRELLPHDARSLAITSAFVAQNGAEPAQLAQTQQVLLQALAKNPKDAAILRSSLAFELYRDRMKDLAKARQVLRDLITLSPTNDGTTNTAISWLLYNSANDAEFKADLERVIVARRKHFQWTNLRSYLPAWIQQARSNKDYRQRAQIARARLKQVDAEPFVVDWLAMEAGKNKTYPAAVARLLRPADLAKMSEDQARTLLHRVSSNYLNTGSAKQRARSLPIYSQFIQRFPKDFSAASSYLYAAATYGSVESAQAAAVHMLSIDPLTTPNNGETWYRLMISAARVKDAELVKRAYAWIIKGQQKLKKDIRYADSIGDYLTQFKMPQEALQQWRRALPVDHDTNYSRSSADRVLRTLEGAARTKFLQDLIAKRSDYHGTFATWLANDYLLAGDLVNFRKTLLASQAIQRERSFRGWSIEQAMLGTWISKYRSDPKATTADKQLVFETIRDLRVGRSSASAQLALLELPPAETRKITPMQRLLAYRQATTMLGNAYTDWDLLIGYAQAAMGRKDYSSVAALVGGMLENVSSPGASRQKAGRDMVAQCYARMGAGGLSIDENSPVAPLLQAALYLRLGDRSLAFDSYLEHQALFDAHRDKLPVDLILFVCESHIAAGGEKNHNRVEDILRGWLVKFSEAADLDADTKASVQLMLAKNYFKAQSFDVARSEYRTVKNRYPKTPQAIEAEFGIGETFMAQKVYDQADSIFEILTGSRDRDVAVRAQFLRGVLANRRGDRDEAREIFRAVLDMVPNVDLANEALFHLAEVYGAEERYIDQLELLRTVGRLGRKSKRWHKPGLALSIVVYDPDLGTSRQHGRIPVKITTIPGGDEETLFLYTTAGGGKGLFRADLETRLGKVTKNDRILQVTGRDVIKVDYPDEFKAEFKSAPISDAEIRIAASGKLEASSSKIIDLEEESLSERIAREEREAKEADARVSQNRPTNQIKPGNFVYLRVHDADRDLSDDRDKVIIKLTATSGDQVRVELTETGPHTGVFEGQSKTAELPAGALASDTAIDHNPLMAIDQDPETYWLSEPDGATPKWLTIDMKDLKLIDRITISTPDPNSQAPVRGQLQGSHDGRFWFRLSSIPPQPPVEPVGGEYGRMKLRLYSGNYTGFTNWSQVVNLSKTGKPAFEEEVDTLSWSVLEDDENAKTARAAIWHGKFFLPRSRGVRFVVTAQRSAIVVDGQLELPVGAGTNRTVDVWLDRGTHDLTIFAATTNPVQGVAASRAIENHNVAQVVVGPFRVSDFDLDQPGAKRSAAREPAKFTSDNGVWDFHFAPYELRHVKLIIEEYVGEAVAINHIRVSGVEDGEVIPTKSDILKLADNGVLEIAAGDVITANYSDEFTQSVDGRSRLLTAELRATYFNAGIKPIAVDLVRQPNGAVTEVRKQLIRIDPGDKFLVEITDYDMDQTSEPDHLRFRIAVNDGPAIELIAQENGEFSGVFVKEIFTSDKPEEGKLVVKQGDRIYCSYLDSQNTFPGHAVPREMVVYVNEPAEGAVRIVETRYLRPDDDSGAPARTAYLPADSKVETAKVAFEVPLTVEVYDRDAAKDSLSKITVQLETSDGSKVEVECVISSQFGQAAISGGLGEQNWALEEGRFIGQVILQLGSKTSASLVPLTANMPRTLTGGPVLTEDERGSIGANLVTRVLNLSGSDVITATYKDKRRPVGGPRDLLALGRLIANGALTVTDRDYEHPIESLHVGEKMYIRVIDADLDTSDERNVATVLIETERGEKETILLQETLAHSGVFTGSVALKPSEKPTVGNFNPENPVIESFFGDTIKLEYLDKAASTESGELKLTSEVPVVIGTDGLIAAFSKTFQDEKLAVETQFHIAESYFELFKSHRKLARREEERDDLKNGRRVLREVMEDYPNPKYTPRIAYLLGQFSQELHQWNEAIDAYRLIVRRYPDHTLAADAQFQLAQCYEKSKEFDQALEEYVTLAATYPKSPLIANVMIRIMEHFYTAVDKESNYEIAAQVGRKFLERFEGHEWAPKVAYRIGDAYFKNEKFIEAAKAYDEFSKNYPKNKLAPDAIFWAGESFWKGKSNAEAYRRFQMCRWKHPASEMAKYARGRLALPEMIAQLEAEARALEDDN